MSFVQGYLVGLAMVVFVGPVLFYLVQVSLEHKTMNGMLVALGIFTSDVVAALLCYFGLGKYLQTPYNQAVMAYAGGLVLVILAIGYLRKKPRKKTSIPHRGMVSRLKFFTNGFLVNFVNPFVFGVWLVVVTFLQANYPNQNDQFLYLAGALLGILTADTAKVFLARQIEVYLTLEKMVKIYRLAGMALLLFALRLFYHAISIVW